MGEGYNLNLFIVVEGVNLNSFLVVEGGKKLIKFYGGWGLLWSIYFRADPPKNLVKTDYQQFWKLVPARPCLVNIQADV